MVGNHVRQSLVLKADHLAREIRVRLVPEGIYTQDLDVDALCVHGGETVWNFRSRHLQALGRERIAQSHQRHRLRKRAVGMHVYRAGRSPLQTNRLLRLAWQGPPGDRATVTTDKPNRTPQGP